MSLKQFLYKANDIPGTHHRNTKKYPGLNEFPLGQELKTQVHKVELFFKMNGTKQNNREIKQAACSMTAPCSLHRMLEGGSIGVPSDHKFK